MAEDAGRIPRPRTRFQIVALPGHPGILAIEQITTVVVTDNPELTDTLLARLIEHEEKEHADQEKAP